MSNDLDNPNSHVVSRSHQLTDELSETLTPLELWNEYGINDVILVRSLYTSTLNDIMTDSGPLSYSHSQQTSLARIFMR